VRLKIAPVAFWPHLHSPLTVTSKQVGWWFTIWKSFAGASTPQGARRRAESEAATGQPTSRDWIVGVGSSTLNCSLAAM
jgi:hypothetical protein